MQKTYYLLILNNKTFQFCFVPKKIENEHNEIKNVYYTGFGQLHVLGNNSKQFTHIF